MYIFSLSVFLFLFLYIDINDNKFCKGFIKKNYFLLSDSFNSVKASVLILSRFLIWRSSFSVYDARIQDSCLGVRRCGQICLNGAVCAGYLCGKVRPHNRRLLQETGETFVLLAWNSLDLITYIYNYSINW